MAERDKKQSFLSFSRPRNLSKEENLPALKFWITMAEVFYAKDPNWEDFFEENVAWDPSLDHYGQLAEQEGLKRSTAKKGCHLSNLLVQISSHLPWPHTQEKILHESKNFKAVWDIVLTA